MDHTNCLQVAIKTLQFISIIKIKPFRLVFACITDIDNQGEVPKGSIIDRDTQASFQLDNQVFSPLLSQPFQV
jgi:hypothetical protein